MLFRSEKGFTGIDIAISVIIITIFISMMANLISNINLNSKKMERTEIATAYAVQEIEKIKAQGYIDNYNEKGIDSEEVLNEEVNDFSKDKSKYERTVEANREFEERSKREMNLFSTDNDWFDVLIMIFIKKIGRIIW